MEIIERILGCLLLLVAAPFASAENHALNPGMEEVREVTDVVGEKISQPVSWVSQTFPYCSATREPANVRSGKGALEIPADAYLLKKIPVVYGDVWKFSFWAKGEGKLRAIIFEYDDIMPNPIWHPRHAVWMLTNEWQQCTFEYSPTALLAERAQRVPTTFIFNLEIRKPSRIGYVDDVVIEKIKEGDGKTPDGKVYWLPDRITELSTDEAAKAGTLIAREDYRVPDHFKPAKIFGREFRFHLRADWFLVPWLAEEPMVKHAMIFDSWNRNIDLNFREMQVYGDDDPKKNLAQMLDRKILGKGFDNAKGIADGIIPSVDARGVWGRLLDPANRVSGGICGVYLWSGLPPDASIGVEFPEPQKVSRVVLYHGRPWNIEVLGQFIKMEGVAADFELEATEDGKTWKPIPGTRVEGNTSFQTEHTFAPITVKAIRIHAWDVVPLYPVKNGNGWIRLHWGMREYELKENRDLIKRLEKYKREVLSTHPWGSWNMMGLYVTPVSPEREKTLAAFEKHWGQVIRDVKKKSKGMYYGGCQLEWEHYTRKSTGRKKLTYWKQQGLPPFTPVAWRSFWARQSDSSRRAIGGPSWCVASGSRPWIHWEALEDDNLAVGDEFKGGYANGFFQSNLVNLRSAARQYGKPWGVYSQPRLGLHSQPGKSEFYHNRSKGGQITALGGGYYTGPSQGVGASQWKRRIWGNYFTGANIQDFEFYSSAAVYWREPGTSTMVNMDGMLNDQGRSMRDLGRLDAKLRTRGATYTPIALLLDYNGGWRPHGYRWQHRLYHEGDDQVNELFLTFFPVAGRSMWGIGYEVANKDVANTPFGEIVDVLKPNLPSGVVPQAQLDAYKVLWMAGSWGPVKGPTGAPINEPKLTARITNYILNGGTLVANAAYLKGIAAGPPLDLNNDMLGVSMTGNVKRSSEAIFALDDEKRAPLKSDPFLYYPMQPAAGTQVIARTPGGDPLMTLHRFGKGHVIVSAIEHNLTEATRLIVPAAERLLRYLTHGLTPFIIEGRCRWIATARKDGWLLMLANNEGVFKDPQKDPEFDHYARKTIKITFDGRVKSLKELTQDYNWPFKSQDGQSKCMITVPAGGVRVLFFKR